MALVILICNKLENHKSNGDAIYSFLYVFHGLSLFQNRALVAIYLNISSFSSIAQSCPTLCDAMNRSTPGLPVITISQSSLRLTSIESLMPSSHLILGRPLLLLPSVFPRIRVFSNESVLCIRWPKYWTFSFNISPSNEYSGLISFRMDWLDLPAVQGTLKSLLQHHRFKSINS